MAMIYSASSAIALQKFGTDYYFFKKQAFFSLAGLGALTICRYIPYRLFCSLTYPILILSIILLAAIYVPGLGYSAGGSTRWLRFGSFTFQPSEFARFAIVIYLAYSMAKKKESLKKFNIGLLPHILALGVFIALIVFQPDFGSVALLAAITWIMLFLGGARFWHLLSPLLLILPCAYWYMISAPYRWDRLMSFWNPWLYPTDEGYQIIHSFMAFGTGGIWGTGIGKGYQKLFYLPEPHTDFIFSVIGEELGLVGVIFIIGLYCLVLWKGISIAKNAKDTFGSFLSIGLTSAISLQVCVNMAVSLGLLPTKGLTLPFLSYGGTSLILSMASIGILMNISASIPHKIKKPKFL